MRFVLVRSGHPRSEDRRIDVPDNGAEQAAAAAKAYELIEATDSIAVAIKTVDGRFVGRVTRVLADDWQ